MLETTRKVAFGWSVPSPELTELVQQISNEWKDQLAEFRESLSCFEKQADEMLVNFADALTAVKSLSLPQFEPEWRQKPLKVAQELFTLPRWILWDDFPEEYKSLRADYVEFVIESDAMGEDVLEFMIAIEKHDLKDAADLFDDLKEGLAKLETLLTSRWRTIARLTREIEGASS
jgi:hypothetical protein